MAAPGPARPGRRAAEPPVRLHLATPNRSRPSRRALRGQRHVRDHRADVGRRPLRRRPVLRGAPARPGAAPTINLRQADGNTFADTSVQWLQGQRVRRRASYMFGWMLGAHPTFRETVVNNFYDLTDIVKGDISDRWPLLAGDAHPVVGPVGLVDRPGRPRDRPRLRHPAELHRRPRQRHVRPHRPPRGRGPRRCRPRSKKLLEVCPRLVRRRERQVGLRGPRLPDPGSGSASPPTPAGPGQTASSSTTASAPSSPSGSSSAAPAGTRAHPPGRPDRDPGRARPAQGRDRPHSAGRHLLVVRVRAPRSTAGHRRGRDRADPGAIGVGGAHADPLTSATPSTAGRSSTRTSPRSRSKELLDLANLCSAPYGTKEYELLQYGVEGEPLQLRRRRHPGPHRAGDQDRPGPGQLQGAVRPGAERSSPATPTSSRPGSSTTPRMKEFAETEHLRGRAHRGPGRRSRPPPRRSSTSRTTSPTAGPSSPAIPDMVADLHGQRRRSRPRATTPTPTRQLKGE